jgi:RecA-family ATPase
MFDSYALADPARAKMIGENLFVEHVLQPFDIAAENGEGLDRLAGAIEKLKIDVLIIDPFLSYFRGNENDNCEVRRALDQFKRQVAERCECGLIITDHQPKYSTADKFAEQKTAMRGAGAKRDWAASVLALAKMKTPDGQHGTFIQATVDKLRYGREPRNPFILRRDDLTFRHSLFKASSVELHEVARVLDEAGGGLSTRALWEKLIDSFSVAGHEARALVKNAIDAGWIETKPGEKRSTIHHLTIKYQEWRDGRN